MTNLGQIISTVEEALNLAKSINLSQIETDSAQVAADVQALVADGEKIGADLLKVLNDLQNKSQPAA